MCSKKRFKLPDQLTSKHYSSTSLDSTLNTQKLRGGKERNNFLIYLHDSAAFKYILVHGIILELTHTISHGSLRPCLGKDIFVSPPGMCFCLRGYSLGLQTFYCTSRILVFAISLSNLNEFASFFFENARNIIPDITAFSEYFILAGELSYVDRRCVGGQNISSRAKRAILYQFNQSLFLHNCRIILYISALPEHFILPGEQVLFHTEGTCTSKSEFSVHRAILHQFTQFFFLHLLKIKEKTSVSLHYFIFTGEGPYLPTQGSHPVNT